MKLNDWRHSVNELNLAGLNGIEIEFDLAPLMISWLL